MCLLDSNTVDVVFKNTSTATSIHHEVLQLVDLLSLLAERQQHKQYHTPENIFQGEYVVTA